MVNFLDKNQLKFPIEETSGWLTEIKFTNQQFWHFTQFEINFIMLSEFICALFSNSDQCPTGGGGYDIEITLPSE